MLDDIFDRNWELAILIQEQYEAVINPPEVNSEQALRFRARSRRIAELLESAARDFRTGMKNWFPTDRFPRTDGPETARCAFPGRVS